jgi:hypothetical protein
MIYKLRNIESFHDKEYEILKDGDNKSTIYNNENLCKIIHGENVYNKCVSNNGGSQECKSCQYCLCVAKSDNSERCLHDELFRECIYNNRELNNYDSSKTCGYIISGKPCKCKSYYTDNDIYFKNQKCGSREKCIKNNNSCYYTNLSKTKTSDDDLCDCDEGILINSGKPNYNKNCLCSSAPNTPSVNPNRIKPSIKPSTKNDSNFHRHFRKHWNKPKKALSCKPVEVQVKCPCNN